MKDKTRAKRRHHQQRMYDKAKRSHLVSAWYGTLNDEDKHACIRKVQNILKVCSCSMCCNHRRNGWDGGKSLTMQERKQAEADRYTFKEEV